MPRARKSTTVTVQEDTSPKITEGQIGRLARDILDLHGQQLKEELVSNSSHYSLNNDQVKEVCKAIDAMTTKSKDAALRQVISTFKS